MREHDGRLVLVDFGLSQLQGAACTFTAAGPALGTPIYMSPESFNAKPVTKL